MKNADNSNAPLENALKDQVSDLYEIMRSEKLEELEIKDENFYVYLKRKGKNVPAAVTAPQVVASVPASAPAPEAAEAAPEEVAGETIKSPIMGVFYRSPSPSMPPFVGEGSVIDGGKTLCIVEAMKVMNEIKADYRLKVLKILVENGKPISAGQDLFLVERA